MQGLRALQLLVLVGAMCPVAQGNDSDHVATLDGEEAAPAPVKFNTGKVCLVAHLAPPLSRSCLLALVTWRVVGGAENLCWGGTVLTRAHQTSLLTPGFCENSWRARLRGRSRVPGGR